MIYPAQKSKVQVLQILFRNVHFLFWIVPNILIKKSTVIPYIKALSENIKNRFNDKVAAMCSSTSIFAPKKVKDDVRYVMTEVVQLASLHSSLNVSDLQDEWKTFQNYVQA